MRTLKSLLVSLLLLPAAVLAEGWVHPFDFPQSDKVPNEFYAVIEIPAGGFTKYEINHDTGHLFVDRFVSMPVAYPTSYGSITQSLGPDGDPLDVLVLARAPIQAGALIKLRPVGYLRMVDGGDVDHKILAVPASKIDPTYDPIRDIGDVAPLEKERIEAFFRVYKQLPAGGKVVEVSGWGNAEEARSVLQGALDAYKAKHGQAAQ